jgi:hypothetical protein
MKLIVLDCLRRWRWLYLLGFIVAIGLDVVASFFSPFGVFTPYFLAPMLGSLFVVGFDLARGAVGVTSALPVSVRKVGISYWIVGVCVPPVLLTLALIVAGFVARPFNPPIPVGWDQVGPTFIISLLINGCVFFILTLLKVGPQEGLWNNVVGGLAGASVGLSAFSPIAVRFLLDSRKADAVTMAALVCVALALSLVGFLRSGDTVRLRARNRFASQTSGKSTGAAPHVTAPAPSGISGFSYLFLESLKFSMGMAVTLVPVAILFRYFLKDNSPFIYYMLVVYALLPSLRHLSGFRQMRALPISLDRLTFTIFLLPLANFSVGLGVILLAHAITAVGELNAPPAALLLIGAIASVGNALAVRFGPKSLPFLVCVPMVILWFPKFFSTAFPLAGHCALTAVLMIAAFAILRVSLRSSTIYRLPASSFPCGSTRLPQPPRRDMIVAQGKRSAALGKKTNGIRVPSPAGRGDLGVWAIRSAVGAL